MNDPTLMKRLARTLREAQATIPDPAPGAVGLLRSRYRRARRRRRITTTTIMILVLITALTAAWRPGWVLPREPVADDPDNTLRMWLLSGSEQRDRPVAAAVERYNRHAKVKIQITRYSNERYKRTLPGALGTPAGPDIFVSWGGEALAELVRAGRVADLTPALAARPQVAASVTPSVLALGVTEGRQYALPMSGAQPAVLFYNRELFTQAGAEPPETIEDLYALVDVFKARGVTPITLPGASGWTELMYLMYLVDRIGGADLAASIASGSGGAWRDPAVLEAARRCRELAERGAFGPGFANIGYDEGVSSERFARGEAAMFLIGSWEYATQREQTPSLVSAGQLGWTSFPAVPGGRGDPRDLVGVPANFFSVVAGSRHQTEAVDFLIKTLTADAFLDDLVVAGDVPVVTGARSSRGQADPFFTFTSQVVAQAPSFTLAWDQALAQPASERLISTIKPLFLGELTAEQFVSGMEQVSGER